MWIDCKTCYHSLWEDVSSPLTYVWSEYNPNENL